MPAKSKSQQRLFGMIHAYKHGKLHADKKTQKRIGRIADGISDEDARHFAETSHDGLPEKKAFVYNKETKEMTDYEEGFMGKCAEYGVSADSLLKAAAALRSGLKYLKALRGIKKNVSDPGMLRMLAEDRGIALRNMNTLRSTPSDELASGINRYLRSLPSWRAAGHTSTKPVWQYGDPEAISKKLSRLGYSDKGIPKSKARLNVGEAPGTTIGESKVGPTKEETAAILRKRYGDSPGPRSSGGLGTSTYLPSERGIMPSYEWWDNIYK